MNKQQLVEEVARELNSSRAHAEKTVKTVLECIKNGLRRDGSVTLVNFGTFLVRTRKARTGRNPRTGETIQIQARRTTAFRPGRELKTLI